MESLTVRTIIHRNRRVAIRLPRDVPEGPAELTVSIRSDKDTRKMKVHRMLARLRLLRRELGGHVRLSQAVIQERRKTA